MPPPAAVISTALLLQQQSGGVIKMPFHSISSDRDSNLFTTFALSIKSSTKEEHCFLILVASGGLCTLATEAHRTSGDDDRHCVASNRLSLHQEAAQKHTAEVVVVCIGI